jgi:hypothetical protein
VFTFGGDLGGNLEVRAGRGGTTQGSSVAATGGGFISATAISLQGAADVTITAGTSGFSRGGVGATGGAIDGLTLQNTGRVGNVTIEAGGGTAMAFTSSAAGTGGAILGSSYANLGGAGQIYVVAGGGGFLLGDTQGTRGDAGAGGALAGFSFNNAALFDSAEFHGGPGGIALIDGDGAHGNGGPGGWITGFMLHDSTGSDSHTVVRGGLGGDGVGTGTGGSGGSVITTRLDTSAVVEVSGSSGGDVQSYRAGSVGGAGGSVRDLTGRVGELTVIGGNATTAHVGGAGGHVYGVKLSEVTSFVRMIQAGNGGDGVVAGRGGSISRIYVPGDIGDFLSAFGTGPQSMGGLVAGQGGTSDHARVGVAGNVSFVTANRIAAIFAGGGALDGSYAVNAITAVRAREIGADTGLPGSVDFPSLRGYGTYTYKLPTYIYPDYSDTPIDGPVVVREHGFNAQSLSVVPLYLILAPG